MNNKSAVNIIGAIIIYLVMAAVIFLLPASVLGPSGEQEQTAFAELFRANALHLLLVTFVCSAIWFAVGEWVIAAWASSRPVYIWWWSLFVIVLAAAAFTAYLGPRGGSIDLVNRRLAWIYLLDGPFTFYLVSVLFSATNVKYAIPPAGLVRRW